jgi:hypothetical protein
MPVILLIPCGYLSLQAKRAIVAYQDTFRSQQKRQFRRARAVY